MTPGLHYGAAVILAAAFAWAALGKLRRPSATRGTLAALGLPGAAAGALPLAELVIAALLLWLPFAGAVAAAAALAVFSAVLWRAQARGHAVGCGCFGAADDDRPVAVALLRNLALALLVPAAAAAQPVPPVLAEVIVLTVAVLLARLVIALAELRLRIGRVWDNRLEWQSEGGA